MAALAAWPARTEPIPIRAHAARRRRAAAAGAADRRAARPAQFFGDARSRAAFDEALARFAQLGATDRRDRHRAFYETARLLYEGPWVAERYAGGRRFIEASPDAVHPVTRQIIRGRAAVRGRRFRALYRLAGLASARDTSLARSTPGGADGAGRLHRRRSLADPIQLNSRLGTYTNFVNLLDLAASRCRLRRERRPAVRRHAPRARRPDAALAALGRVIPCRTGLPLGATGRRCRRSRTPPATRAGQIAVAVVGAHLSGMPLNGELQRARRPLLGRATAPDYKLYALPGTAPPKPGLLRVARRRGRAHRTSKSGR